MPAPPLFPLSELLAPRQLPSLASEPWLAPRAADADQAPALLLPPIMWQFASL